MSNLMDQIITQYTNNKSSESKLSDIRENAIAAFNNLGLPAAKHEEWRYTRVSPLFSKEMAFAQHAELSEEDVNGFRLPGEAMLPFRDLTAAFAIAAASALPVAAEPLAYSLAEGNEIALPQDLTPVNTLRLVQMRHHLGHAVQGLEHHRVARDRGAPPHLRPGLKVHALRQRRGAVRPLRAVLVDRLDQLNPCCAHPRLLSP